MEQNEPLHEMNLKVVAGGEARLWSLTAKPAYDREGSSSAIAASGAT